MKFPLHTQQYKYIPNVALNTYNVRVRESYFNCFGIQKYNLNQNIAEETMDM